MIKNIQEECKWGIVDVNPGHIRINGIDLKDACKGFRLKKSLRFASAPTRNVSARTHIY
jgi:hypothetical protein